MVIAGGTGFIGSFLAERFRALGNEVIIVARKKGDLAWTDHPALVQALNGAEVLINLAGRSVDCRYNDANKKEILDSRVQSTRLLGEAMLACRNPPTLWINTSTATIYRHAEDRPMTEEDGEIGEGFSVSVAKQWEQAFFHFHLPHTRQVALRMAIVLGRDGGVMKPLKRLTRFGLGGKQGKGNQMFSWIHIEDVFQIILFLMDRQEIDGVVNVSSPGPVRNHELMLSLRKSMKKRIGLPAPEWLLRIGAVFIRTETELVLKSRWVLPGRLLKAGYRFRYPSLAEALEDLRTKNEE
jgi:uncharacterized protein